nr:hypothetical protein Itr_chr08CG10050 [Ipomoea trifida]
MPVVVMAPAMVASGGEDAWRIPQRFAVAALWRRWRWQVVVAANNGGRGRAQWKSSMGRAESVFSPLVV